MSFISKYTVVSIDVPSVVNNINRILTVERTGVVDRTNDIYFENKMCGLQDVTEEHSIVVFGAMDNTSDAPFCSLGLPHPLFRDRFRCSALQMLFPVATVWSMNEADPCHKNKNHLRYQGAKDDKTVCAKLLECSLYICDYLGLTRTSATGTITSFLDFVSAALQSTKKTGHALSNKSVAIFPNRLLDAKRHRELRKFFEVKFISKEAFEWYRIGDAYESEICASHEALADAGLNARALRDIDAVAGAEFVVLYRRLERSPDMIDDDDQQEQEQEVFDSESVEEFM